MENSRNCVDKVQELSTARRQLHVILNVDTCCWPVDQLLRKPRDRLPERLGRSVIPLFHGLAQLPTLSWKEVGSLA